MTKRTTILVILTLFIELVIAQSVTVVPSETIVCPTEHVQLTASGALFYFWSPSIGLSNVEGHTVIASPDTTTTYTVAGYNLSDTELVVNGDFEMGNVNFYSDYTYVTGYGSMFFGSYSVTTDGQLIWGQDHLYGYGGTGQFMLIDGAEIPNSIVWEQTVNVVPNTHYAFSAQVVSTGHSNYASQWALLQFCVNGETQGEIFHSPNVLHTWEQYYELWYSGEATTATLTILNQNTDGAGNDFGLDDISFRELEYVNEAQSVVDVRNSYEPVFFTESACDQFIWYGQTYTASGQYDYSSTNNNGCDSIFILNLTINNSDTTYLSEISCDNYIWNNTTYYQSGVYKKTLNTVHGCDSIVFLDLDIQTGHNIAIHGKPIIFPLTDITSGHYFYFIDSTDINLSNVHWDINREDWLLIPHGASCNLVCTSEGQAVLRAWTEGELCEVDTTMVLNASFYSVGENEIPSAIVYPNPTSGRVTIAWRDIVAIKVFNLLGQKVDEYNFEKQDQVELDLHEYQEAVYVLEISTSDMKVYKSVVLTK